jgi:hypothetical protein
MKRKRGRPRGRKYPPPQTTAEGFDIATYGKIGGTEAMDLIRDCPYLTSDYIRKKDRKRRDRVDNEYLRRESEFAEKWAHRIGPVLGKHIAAGNGDFFRQLADAVELCSSESWPIESDRRYLAMEYKLLCYVTGISFNRAGLRAHYKHRNPKDKFDSSTFAKIFKWAQSAKPSYEAIARDLDSQRISKRSKNQNL